MARGRQSAHLRHRNTDIARAELGLAHGQLHARTATARLDHLLLDELALRPAVPDVLAIGQRADALLPELTQQTVRGPLPIEHHDEPVKLWIVVQFSCRGLLRHAEQQLRHDVLEQGISQPFGDSL